MPNWSSGDVIANGIRIRYTRTGGDKLPLVLSHGFSDNGLCWTRLVKVLERDYDIIMVDVRGHGLSEAPEGGHDADTRAADLAGVVTALGLGKAALMGHSMGASTVAATAANHPQVVRCAILEDPPWRAALDAAAAREWAARRERNRVALAERQTQSHGEVVASGKTQHPTWDDIEWGPWADSKLQLSPHVVAAAAPTSTPWQDVVRKITCPTLLITADNSLGAIVTPEIAEEAASIWQDGRMVHIPEAGHNIRREQFEKFVEVVSSYLKGL